MAKEINTRRKKKNKAVIREIARNFFLNKKKYFDFLHGFY